MRLAALLWLPVLLVLGGAAAADDGRPARTVERLADRVAPRDVIVLIGGYGTDATDGTWATVSARFAGDPRYVVHRFGSSPGRPYDTTGPVDTSARTLIAEVRALAGGGARVHLVAHSMGGVVADRAFALGLGAADGVRSYVALASPHSGSTIARVARDTLDRAGEDRAFVRETISSLASDPDTPAVADLAAARAPAVPPEGIAHVALRSATDSVVSRADARGPPGAETRTLLPASLGDLEGHGAILRDARAVELIAATVSTGGVPRDERGAMLRAATDAASDAVDALVSLAAALTAAAVLLLARLSRPFRTPALAPR